MSFLLIIHITLVTLCMNFSPAFQSVFTYGNETDRLALLKLKSELTNYYYPQGDLKSWNDSSDHCSWTGIQCNLEHPRRVTILELRDQKRGSNFPAIPTDIGNLTFLITLRLMYNSFQGTIPQEVGRLYRLRFLDLSYNNLSGGIPSSLGNCFDLKGLYLNSNNLRGTIPPSLQSLKGIQELVLDRNRMSGPIPEYVGSFFSLRRLDLSHNQLNGEIPSSLKNCLDLKRLYLNGNNLTGIIPPSLESLKRMQELILGSNYLSGPIPEFLESFHSLETLDLSWNDFEGEVPKQGIFKNTSASCFYYGNSKLCGGNPLQQLPSCTGIISMKQRHHFPLKRLLLILFGVVGVICAIILGSLIYFLRRRKATIQPSSCESDYGNGNSSEYSFSDMFPKVSYDNLLRATDGFSSKNLVGVGGYGSVYIGILVLSQEITSVVAVKVLDLQRRGALKSFKAECEALRCIRHRNVMKILTSCSSVDFNGNEFKALVYEFMPNGSLENWLHPKVNYGRHQRSTNRPLKFRERLNIAIDVASALDYLHRQCQTPIAHCDLKPSNILLDEDMNGHLGDFGSARFLGGVTVEHRKRCSTSLIRGSIGYVAPEYGMGRAVSTNGDIYSFGIMLLELFTGRRPTANMFKDGLTLHSFAKTALITDRVMEIVDHTLVILQNNYENEENAKFCEALKEIIKVGVTCSTEMPKERMDMELVVTGLQSIKNMFSE